MENKVLIIRTRRCRKSDVVIRFLKENNIPHTVKYVEDDKEAQKLTAKYNLKSSPGIIVNGEILNPYKLVERCKVKMPRETREKFLKLLNEVNEDTE